MNKIIINNLLKASNLLFITLPLLYGCGGSEGGGSLGSLLGTSSSGVALASAQLSSGADLTMAVCHNPEPATMLLLGGGMLALGFLKSRMHTNKHS